MSQQELVKLSKVQLIDRIRHLESQLDAFGQKASGRSTHTQGSYFEGEATLEGGDLVGRDQHVGLNGAEIRQLFETLLKYFPRGYLHPTQLDKVLNQFRQYHEQLKEWKDLHDALDRLIIAFDPYKVEVQASDRTRKVPRAKDIRALWFPVSQQVSALLEFAKGIKSIGQQFQVLEDGSKVGIKPAIDLDKFCLAIDELMEAPPTFLQCLSFRFMGVDVGWWRQICRLVGEFDHVVTQQMSLVDRQLRDTATELYHLSTLTLWSQEQ